MQRVIERELLDDLPVADARAMRERRDLRRVNWWMRGPSIAARSLRRACSGWTPESLTDLGSGDGHFFARVGRELPRSWRRAHVVLADCRDALAQDAWADLVSEGWNPRFIQTDALEWAASLLPERHAVVMTNLLLHQFSQAQLRQLFESLADSVQAVVACEPRRSAWTALAVRCVGVIGCGAVTRTDGTISVRAGFRDTELAALWPRQSDWTITERWVWPFSHVFVATRR